MPPASFTLRSAWMRSSCFCSSTRRGALASSRTLIALQADQAGTEHLGHRLGQLGLAGAGRSFDHTGLPRNDPPGTPRPAIPRRPGSPLCRVRRGQRHRFETSFRRAWEPATLPSQSLHHVVNSCTERSGLVHRSVGCASRCGGGHGATPGRFSTVTRRHLDRDVLKVGYATAPDWRCEPRGHPVARHRGMAAHGRPSLAPLVGLVSGVMHAVGRRGRRHRHQPVAPAGPLTTRAGARKRGRAWRDGRGGDRYVGAVNRRSRIAVDDFITEVGTAPGDAIGGRHQHRLPEPSGAADARAFACRGGARRRPPPRR